MEIPPISTEEEESEWTLLQSRMEIPEARKYVARNLVMIRKCFGGLAYASAMQDLFHKYPLKPKI